MDSRDTKFIPWYVELNPQRMIATVTTDGEETREIKFHFEVCHVCRGRGQYVNPNIDRHGLSREEMMEWEPEEIQDYRNGEYNVQCGYCNGQAVEPIPDDAEVIKQHQADIDSMHKWQAEIELEARMLGEY